MIKVAVIGGGASGLLAAGTAAAYGAKVVLFEKNEKLGKKIYITGKGRCNVTNAAENAELVQKIVRNPKFMLSSLSQFSSADTVALIERMGCPLKVERGQRVFPVSDKSSDIIRALSRYVTENGAEVRLNTAVKAVSAVEGGGYALVTDRGTEVFHRVIVATGGISYSATGSTGDGYRFAKGLGHTVTPLSPSLVGFYSNDPICALAGLTLKNVGVTLLRGGELANFLDYQKGELLLTGKGISGPVALTLSAQVCGRDKGLTAVIDFKPALSTPQLIARLTRECNEQAKKALKNILCALSPKALVPILLKKSGIDGEKQGAQVSLEDMGVLSYCYKNYSVALTGTEPIERAVVTCGGVNVRELNPRTMESKKHSGLYFAGEVIDVDAYTGGFNLQIAFSTGYAAGMASAME